MKSILLIVLFFTLAACQNGTSIPDLPNTFYSDVIVTVPMFGKVPGKMYYDFPNQRTRLDISTFGMDMATLDFYLLGVEFQAQGGMCRVGKPRTPYLTPMTIPPFATYQGQKNINGVDCETWVANFMGVMKMFYYVTYLNSADGKVTPTLVRYTINMPGMDMNTDFSNVVAGPLDEQIFDFIALGCRFQPPPPPPVPKFEVSGYAKNAINNKVIPGAVVVAVEAGVSATADREGKFTLRDLPAGNLTLIAHAADFYNATTVLFLNKSIVAGTDADFSLSPVLKVQGYRIVLKWGALPTDLDSHLSTPWGEVSYTKKSVTSPDSKSSATLDVDDTSSYGPETITITSGTGSVYRYFVFNYSSKPAIGTSSATVSLYNGSGLYKTYNVPSGLTDRTWNVFTIQADGSVTDN